MTDDQIPPDPLVEAALQLLPIPSHLDGFWERLGRSLGAEAARGDGPVLRPASAPRRDTTTPGLVVVADPVEPAALVPAAFRRPSNAVLATVAAAAVVIVALAGSSLLDARSGTQRLSAADVQASAALDALVADAQAAPGTPVTISAGAERASSAAVLTWVDDLHAGDGAAAWAALGERSQTHFGSMAGFAAQMPTLEQSTVRWTGDRPEEIYVTPMASDEGDDFAVVTVVGTVTVDGVAVRRAIAFPVRLTKGAAHLEPFATELAVEMVQPAADVGVALPVVAVSDHLVMVVPPGAAAPVVRLDDGPAMVCGEAVGTELIELAGGVGQRCAYQPDADLSRGEHTLTVAFVAADGASVAADALLFEAA